MAPKQTPPSTPDDEGASTPAPKGGPVRIQPAKMVVSGPPKRRGAKGSSPATPTPATRQGGAGAGAPDDRAGLLATLEAQRAAATAAAAANAERAAAEGGLPARRLLFDAAAALAVTGALILAATFVLAPRDEEAAASATPTSAPSEAVASATPATTATAAPTSAPSATVAPTAAPSATPPAGGYDVGSACVDAPDCFFYVIREGDTLAAIGRGLGVTRTGILALNPGLGPDDPLVPGSTVRVPTPATE